MARTEYDPCTPSPRMFWEFCSVRMDEWWNRQTGAPPPYTPDPILRIKSIPNVFRELDYETRWLNQQLIVKEPKNALFGSVSFRLTNRVPPHEMFGGTPNVDQLEKWITHLNTCRNNGIPAFTTIFHTPSLFRYAEAMTDIAEHADDITDKFIGAGRIEKSFEVLNNLPRVKNFFAWQCMSDLMEAKVVDYDEDEWCFLGPGPIRAMNMMYGERFSQATAMGIARKLRDVQHRALANTRTPWRPPPHIPQLTLKNIEHALCEYFRWVWAHWR